MEAVIAPEGGWMVSLGSLLQPLFKLLTKGTGIDLAHDLSGPHLWRVCVIANGCDWTVVQWSLVMGSLFMSLKAF